MFDEYLNTLYGGLLSSLLLCRRVIIAGEVDRRWLHPEDYTSWTGNEETK